MSRDPNVPDELRRRMNLLAFKAGLFVAALACLVVAGFLLAGWVGFLALGLGLGWVVRKMP